MIRNCRGKYLPAISLHRNNVSRLITSKKGNIFYRDGGGTLTEFLTDPQKKKKKKNSGYPINSISKDHKEKIDLEITSLLNKKVIVASSTEPGEYISPIFSVPKKDNKARLILNLKRLNEHVKILKWIPYILHLR